MSRLAPWLPRTLPWLLIYCGFNAHAAAPLAPLSATPDGMPAPPWREIRLGTATAANRFSLEDSSTGTVLVLQSDNSASGVGQTLNASANAVLAWQWKVTASLDGLDPTTQEGDDYAARVYVLFGPRDGDTARWWQLRKRLLGWMSGVPVPETTLCYVWAGDAPEGQTVPGHYPSPYSDDVRIVVVERGPAASTEAWTYSRRNLLQDHIRAFDKPPGSVIGVILAADTDNDGSRTTAWFRNVELTPIAASPAP